MASTFRALPAPPDSTAPPSPTAIQPRVPPSVLAAPSASAPPVTARPPASPFKADGDIALLAAQNTATMQRDSGGSGYGVGVAMQIGSGGASAGLTGHASTSTRALVNSMLMR
ncbi:MAG TPA: hemagglutinin repeat-containing protein [Xylella sp.]